MRHEVVVTGCGVVSALGCGTASFFEAILAGCTRFAPMTRPGRQSGSGFVGAEIASPLVMPERAASLATNISLSAQAALVAVEEALTQCGLTTESLSRAALFLGGGNLQQRELLLLQEKYRLRPRFVSPGYGLCFQDTDIAAICCEVFGIRGGMLAVNGASASGLLAIIQAAEAIACGIYPCCVVVGALQDISHWEAQALTNMGAMAPVLEGERPSELYRPFDRHRRGFVFGEGCAALVLERKPRQSVSDERALAGLTGWAMVAEGQRSPAASSQAESRVIRKALSMAALSASQIDYVNPHGSGSLQGDEAELAALRECGLEHAYINSTKSLTGHTLAAAGAVETVATILQMRTGRMHASKNLSQPIDEGFNWVRGDSAAGRLENALKLSFGFGGINCALCLSAA